MVTPVASLGRSGLADFVLQRVSAVVIVLYGAYVTGFFATVPVDHAALRSFFAAMPMRAFTTLAVIALAAHAWIGMWTIGTDYVRRHYFGRRHAMWLALYQAACLCVVFVYLAWPLTVVWRL